MFFFPNKSSLIGEGEKNEKTILFVRDILIDDCYRISLRNVHDFSIHASRISENDE